MLYWILGGVALVIVLGGVVWLASQLRAAMPRLIRPGELAGRSRAELHEQIARILEQNRRDEEETCQVVVPSVLVFPSPTWRRDAGTDLARRSLTLLPELFHRVYYGPEARAHLDSPDVRELVVDAAQTLGGDPLLNEDALFDLVDRYEGDANEAPTLAARIPYTPGDRALSLLLIDTARLLDAGVTRAELRARWKLSNDARACASLEQKLAALAVAETEKLIEAARREAEILATVEPGFRTERVRPRFFTAERAERHRALLDAVAARDDVDPGRIEVAEPLRLEVRGLLYPIDFVMDMGTHVAALSRPEIERAQLSLEALRALAIENLAGEPEQPTIPKDEVVTFRDAHDHGAAYVLLLPSRLGEDETCLVLAPSHDTLVLYSEGDPDLAAKARAIFADALANGDGDAPIPTPVRVSPRGFEAVGWA
ncbi:MAG: hypothetical protein AB7S26_30780 [Sandaracinaceae bacterium]